MKRQGVIIRTLDVGGQEVPYLKMGSEQNPFWAGALSGIA